MDQNEFKDSIRFRKEQNDFRDWLKNRPGRVGKSIALRATLRVLPYALNFTLEKSMRRRNPAFLTLFQVVITAAVAFRFPEDGISASLVRRSMAYDLISPSHGDPGIASGAVLDLAMLVGRMPHISLPDFILPITRTSWDQVKADIESLDVDEDLIGLPLFQSSYPDWFSSAEFVGIKNLTNETGDPNSFWHRWWEGAKSGQWLDWDLQREVALIPDEVWQSGPKAVAEAIARIEEKFALREQVSQLRAELESVQQQIASQASLAHRSHNQPPELVETPATVIVQVATLVSELREAETEVEKQHPDPGVLSRIGTALIASAKAVLGYCASLADVALKKSAEEIGTTGTKWAIGLVGLGTISSFEKVQAIGSALLRFAEKLAGG